MATPLRSRNVIAKLPASITSMTGEALYLWLSKALNGLRSASQEWNVYLSSIVDKCRLRSCGLEPCLYSGLLPSGEPCMILSYVDDLICVGPSVDAIDFVFDTVGKSVRLKRTGLIHDHSKGGQLRFLGRLITRRRGEKSLLISLPSNYLDDTFASYQIKTNAKGPPDVTPVIDRDGGEELSIDAYARFRAALGKVSWMAQTRGDLRAWIGILATQQSKPNQYTEHAMRMLLRYLRGDMNVAVRFPSDSPLLHSEVFQGSHIVAFSDASHAPLKATGRRGISGGVLTFQGCTLKTLSRHQALVSLSSMESELYALQSVSQEMVSMGKMLGRILFSFKELESSEIPGVLRTDSESSIKLLKGLDLPRKSRHLEIRIEWLRERVELGKLKIHYEKGSNNPADALTKCLGSSIFGIHRAAMGFEVLDAPLGAIMAISSGYVFIEVCCKPDSSISKVARRFGFLYIGVVENMEKKTVFDQVVAALKDLGKSKVFVHVSSPCSSGSPLRNFRGDNTTTEADVIWFDVIPHVAKYMKLGKYSSFELPWRNAIWTHAMTTKILNQAQHKHVAAVHLCSTGSMTKDGEPVGKVLKFTSNSKLMVGRLAKDFGQCHCTQKHAGLTNVDWAETAFYNENLAVSIVRGALDALRNDG